MRVRAAPPHANGIPVVGHSEGRGGSRRCKHVANELPGMVLYRVHKNVFKGQTTAVVVE